MIKNILPNKSGNPQSLGKQSQHLESFSTNEPIVGVDLLRAFHRLFYLQFCDTSDHCVANVLLTIWEIFLHQNNPNYNSYRFSYKFAFIPFLSFLTNQKQESGFQLLSWWSGNEKYFCFLFIASRVLLQSHAEFNRLL